MKFSRYVFWTAAAYGVLVIFPLFFSEQKLAIDYPPPMNHPEYYYSFAGVTLVWQFLFMFIAMDPVRYRRIMIPCMVEKLSLFPTFAILWSRGSFPILWVPLLVIDLGFGVLFFLSYRKVGVEAPDY